MNEIVRNWINGGCNYWEGVAIYEQMGSNEAVKNILKLGSTSFFEQKLKAAMMELLKNGEEKVNAKVESEKLKVRNLEVRGQKLEVRGQKLEVKGNNLEVRSYRKDDIYTLPGDVGELIKLKGQTYKDAATLHATLLKAKGAERRKQAAYEILRLMAINQNCWAKLNYYDKYGALPVEDVPANYTEMNAGERDLLIQRHRVYLSRHKWLLKPDAVEHPKYMYYSEEYARRKKELEELEKVA